ncbi:MAG: hypothetical protein ACI8P9_004245 [Parasphingorhabdus sp.]
MFRNEKANGFLYLVRSLSALFEKTFESGKDYSFVLKIDTDTLFIDSGIDKIILDRFNSQGPGVVGNYQFNSYGEPRDFRRMKYKLYLDSLPIGYPWKFKNFGCEMFSIESFID